MDDKENLTGKTWHELTKYPKIFGESYWGNFPEYKQGRNFDANLHIICENRNKLAEEYKLKRMYNPSLNVLKQTVIPKEIFDIDDYKGRKREYNWKQFEYCGNDLRDHKEYYSTTDKKVVAIFTTHCREHKEYKKAIEMGYIEVAPLYSTYQYSLLKVVNCKM